MATKPPSRAIMTESSPPGHGPSSGPLSESLAMLERFGRAGIILAPLDPSPDAIARAARDARINPEQALRAYRILAGIGPDSIN